MRRLKKIFIPKLNGSIFVEHYNYNNEEKDRAKIYDENKQYLDYISLDCKTKKEYKEMLDYIKNSSNIEYFIEYVSGQTKYDYSESLEYLLYSIFDDADNETLEELEQDIKKLSKQELIDKYSINMVGDYYFYLGDY